MIFNSNIILLCVVWSISSWVAQAGLVTLRYRWPVEISRRQKPIFIPVPSYKRQLTNFLWLTLVWLPIIFATLVGSTGNSCVGLSILPSFALLVPSTLYASIVLLDIDEQCQRRTRVATLIGTTNISSELEGDIIPLEVHTDPHILVPYSNPRESLVTETSMFSGRL